MVTEQIFNLVFGWFSTIKEVLELIKINFGGVTVNLWQFSLGLIVFGLLVSLFINYAKSSGSHDLNRSLQEKHDNESKG